MEKTAVDPKIIDSIITKTIETIHSNKEEIREIASTAQKRCKDLEVAYYDIKNQLTSTKKEMAHVEIAVKNQKLALLNIREHFSDFTQVQIKHAYEKTDDLIIKLSLLKHEEGNLEEQREYLEKKIVESYKTLHRAEKTLENIHRSLNYLTGNLVQISEHLDNVAQKYQFGLKIIKAQEEERKRVAKDIFNGPIRYMLRAVDMAELCHENFDKNLEEAQKDIKSLKIIVRESLKDIRQIIYNLRPMSLDDLGLIPTLQKYVEDFAQEAKINILFKSSHSQYTLANTLSLTIFRTVQESLINIKKHSRANSARVMLEFLFNKLNLLIADDGIGFDLDIIKEESYSLTKYFGLFSINEKIELLKGTFDVITKPQEGTKILITVPLDYSDNDLPEG